jgi:nucleotide-binding universal stress UspA family protein
MDHQRINDLNTLLVPLDGHDSSIRAVPVAGRLARRLGMDIRLLSIVDGADGIAERSARLADIAAAYLPQTDAAIQVVVANDPVYTVTATAEPDGLLCMATAASLRMHHARFGSIAEGVARAIQRPLFLVGPRMLPRPGAPTQRVVVPIDGSELSEAALDVAADLAVRLSIPLWVVSVVTPKADSSAGPASASPGESNYVRNRAKLIAERTGVDASFEVLHGDPAEAIAGFVADDGTAVMTTHGRSGLSRLFAGSVTTAVVARSQRAVMVLRPPGLE